MKAILFFITFLILVTYNKSNEAATSMSETSKTQLEGGEHYIDIDGVKLWYLFRKERTNAICLPIFIRLGR